MKRQVLGDYALIKKIGQGSLGEVFLAEHKFTKKSFAIKMLPEELSEDRGFIQRFRDEVSVLAAFDHKNLVKIYDISFDDGVYFLVTECVVDSVGENVNLAQYSASRRVVLSEDEVLKIMKQIAEALDYIHSKGSEKSPMVHGAIKLNNILISENQGEIVVKVSDFGLAKIIGMGTMLTRTYLILAESLGIVPALMPTKQKESGGYSTKFEDSTKLNSLHASFLQNYSFLSPEQKRSRDPHSIGAKVDQYAFGVLAYYLLMLSFPEGFFELPSGKLKNLKYNWDQIIINCLQPNPTNRPLRLATALEEDLTKNTSSAFLKKEETSKKISSINSIVKNEKPSENASSNKLLTTMTTIEGGEFYRGSDDGNRDERPKHKISLKTFALDIHPVTNEQFIKFLETIGDEKDNNNNDIIKLKDSRIKKTGGKLAIEPGYLKHPVVGVSWYGAIYYAKWVNKRLPTEAEWEIAALGGNNFVYSTGNSIEKNQANFFSSDTTAVMSYDPNAFGIFDMAGNVYEWCRDWYDHKYYEISMQEPHSPQGPVQGVYRVLRGGCWKSLKEDLRCSHRHRNNPGTMNSTYGFRCAMSVER